MPDFATCYPGLRSRRRLLPHSRGARPVRGRYDLSSKPSIVRWRYLADQPPFRRGFLRSGGISRLLREPRQLRSRCTARRKWRLGSFSLQAGAVLAALLCDASWRRLLRSIYLLIIFLVCSFHLFVVGSLASDKREEGGRRRLSFWRIK